MPLCERANEMLLETRGHYDIVALTRSSRWLIYILVCLPKFIISIAMLCLGCRYLSATANFENLVMNTVALEFVLTVDETVYAACVPVPYRKQVSDINFKVWNPP